MNEYRNWSKDKEKTVDSNSTTHSIDYPLYLQNIKYNLQQILINYHIHIINRENQSDYDDQQPNGMFSLLIGSDIIYSDRYQLITQTFLNQQTFSFYIKHYFTLNNRHLLIQNKLSINVALILLNKINQFMDNIQLIIDPVSGKIFFQTKSFINQSSLSHLKKNIHLHDCFYTQIIAYSIKMALRYLDLVLFLIGEISLSKLLLNKIIKKQFQFLSQSQKVLLLLQKSISSFSLFGNENNSENKSLNPLMKQSQEQDQDQNLNYFEKINKQKYALNLSNKELKNKILQKDRQQSEYWIKSQVLKNLQFFTPNMQSILGFYCSQKCLYWNIDISHCYNMFQKIQLRFMNKRINLKNDRTVKQLEIQSSKQPQYSKKILVIIQVLNLEGKTEEQEGQWKILSQGGFGVVQIAIVRFKNFSISYQYESQVVIRQHLVRKRDKNTKKNKINRERKILQKLQSQSHPNIANFYISYQPQYQNAIFLDYTPHLSLDLYLKKNPLSISFTNKLLFVLQAIEGLIFLHSRKIVHLDIKPGNMLVHKTLRIQLSDFGEAFIIDQDNMQTHQHAYTIPYCAPEIFNDSPVLSQCADIYAIGVCLIKQVLDEIYLETFLRKRFTFRLSKGQIDKYSIGQKFETSFLSPIFKIVEYISLMAISKQKQKRPHLKWIKQILEMCRNFIINLIY